jgi:PEP-CTERM motif
MNCHTFESRRAVWIFGTLVMASCVALLGFSPPALAGSITYPGPFSPPGSGITFQPVIESSGTDPVPLYGPPHVASPIALDFDPLGFVATASGGATDITDGQLNYTITSLFVNNNNGVGIASIALAEAGDYTLTTAGAGTAATRVIAGADMYVKVDAIDGNTLVNPIVLNFPSSSITKNLIANPGILQPWNLGFTFPIQSQLTSMQIPFAVGATKVEVVIDDQLIAQSETQSLAFIAKKDFVNSVGTVIHGDPFVPEPSTIALATLGSLAMALGFGYRKSRAAAK